MVHNMIAKEIIHLKLEWTLGKYIDVLGMLADFSEKTLIWNLALELKLKNMIFLIHSFPTPMH